MKITLRLLMICATFLLSPLSLAADSENCRVFAGDLHSVYEGYPIVYEDVVTNVLIEKGYRLVFREEQADYLLVISLSTSKKGQFERAVASYSWLKTTGTGPGSDRSEFKRCWTEFCSAGDFLKPLSRLVKRMRESLPACTDHSLSSTS